MTNLSLPHPLLIDGLSYIPPPPAKAFEAEFTGILPPGKDIQSSWGITHYYDFSPDASPDARKVLLIHGVGTSAIGMAPLAHQLAALGARVVTYDLWGHGNSSTPLATHTPALMHAQNIAWFALAVFLLAKIYRKIEETAGKPASATGESPTWKTPGICAALRQRSVSSQAGPEPAG